MAEDKADHARDTQGDQPCHLITLVIHGVMDATCEITPVILYRDPHGGSLPHPSQS